MTEGRSRSRHRTDIQCNNGGCALICESCGVLDQGDSPAAMERMKHGKTAHERKTAPARTSS